MGRAVGGGGGRRRGEPATPDGVRAAEGGAAARRASAAPNRPPAPSTLHPPSSAPQADLAAAEAALASAQNDVDVLLTCEWPAGVLACLPPGPRPAGDTKGAGPLAELADKARTGLGEGGCGGSGGSRGGASTLHAAHPPNPALPTPLGPAPLPFRGRRGLLLRPATVRQPRPRGGAVCDAVCGARAGRQLGEAQVVARPGAGARRDHERGCPDGGESWVEAWAAAVWRAGAAPSRPRSLHEAPASCPNLALHPSYSSRTAPHPPPTTACTTPPGLGASGARALPTWTHSRGAGPGRPSARGRAARAGPPTPHPPPAGLAS